MKINFLKLDGTVGFDPTIPVAAQTQLTAAAKLFTNAFTEKYYDAATKSYKDVQINIQVGFGDSGGALGKSNATFAPQLTYNNPGNAYIDPDKGAPQLLQRLVDDRTTIDDKTAIDNLPKTIADTQKFTLTRANAKALGIIASDSASDGKIMFNGNSDIDTGTAGTQKFDYTHAGDASGKLSDPNTYDFFGVATHEISEILGRNSWVVTGGAFNSYGQVLDLFKRADADKTLKFDGGVANSFSIDAGITKLLAFNAQTIAGSPVKPNGDFADLANSVAGDAWRAFAELGKVANVSAADMRIMDVIGYDKKATDLVFAIDTTGSMTPYINNVKTNAIKIVNEAFGPSTAPDSIDARIAIVGFKDAAGPNGPGENTAILKFTEQNTFAARKTAAINAINGITVSGGGDIPEGDNSALLFALRDQGLSSSNPLPAGKGGEYTFSGNFRKNADHKIVLFSDAPIKDTGLASAVENAAKKLNTTVPPASFTTTVSEWAAGTGMTLVDASDIVYGSSGAVGNFTFAVPAEEGIDGGEGEPGPIVPSSAPPTTIAAQVFVVQVGSDTSAAATLSAAASNNGGSFFTGDETNLADIILKIINLPPPTATNFVQDFNGDGNSDILWRHAGGQVAEWQMNGAQIAANLSVAVPGNEWHFQDTGDLDGDGKSDVMWRHDTGQVVLWRMNGNQIVSNTSILNVSNQYHVQGVADFGGDGKSDVLFRHDSGQVVLWQMNGDQIAANTAIATVSRAFHIEGVGDFGGDGKGDVLWRDDSGQVVLWQMNGDKIAVNTAIANVSQQYHVQGIGDLNGDGMSDVIWRHDSGQIVLWQMNGDKIVANTQILDVSNQYKIQDVRDYNGDGMSDILLRHDSGQVVLWTMNGDKIASNVAVATLGNDWAVQSHHFDLV